MHKNCLPPKLLASALLRSKKSVARSRLNSPTLSIVSVKEVVEEEGEGGEEEEEQDVRREP